MNKMPGFNAVSSLSTPTRIYRATSFGTPSVPFSSVMPQANLWFDVWSGCPPGMRWTYVEGKFQTKYCNGPDLKLFPCGIEYVRGHWECSLPRFTTLG